MPHKKQKRSIRLAQQDAKGYNNPPTASDSLLPIASTSYHGEPIELEGLKGGGKGSGTGVEVKKNNKRRKPANAANGVGGNGNGDLNGMSKSAYRILNADKLRQEYNADKKRKREEEEALKNPKKKNKASSTSTTKTADPLKPLPYESLATFNHRVEQEMRHSINSTIAASKNVNKKTKQVLKDKDLDKKLAKKGGKEVADDIDEEWGGIGEGGEEEEEGGEGKRYGKEKKEKPSPEESRDPFAKQPKKPKVVVEGEDGGDEEAKGRLQRGRTGKTEFDQAPQVKGLKQVVLAPPTLAKPARKGLLAKALQSSSDGTQPAGARLSEGTAGGFGSMRIAGMEEPVGKNRLPVDPVMKALLDREREKAVRIYRELKEQKFAEKAQPRQ
ncbi:hypothetical protein JCM16303_007235 [Sporobolomyces ruberrimus]